MEQRLRWLFETEADAALLVASRKGNNMETSVSQSSGLSDRARVIDQLVTTYRELNTKYRPLDEETLRSSGVRDIIERMRSDEMLFAQALKERITGVGTASVNGEDEPVIGNESADDTTVMVISQFGNARATTLTLLKQIEEGDWQNPTDDGKTILDHARDLAESDRNQIAKLERLIAGR